MSNTNTSAGELMRQGLWHNNPGLVQLLGLCPLLAVSNTVVNALGLGLATLLVLAISNLSVSLLRHQLTATIRIPIFVLVIATAVTCVELLMRAWLNELYLVLGIFIPLIVTNCTIIARAEAFASRHAPGAAIIDALGQGLGFAAVLMVIGGMRELLGRGTLFAGAEQLLGSWAKNLTLQPWPDYDGFLLAVLPPGAFFALGLLVALKNWIDQRWQARTTAPSPMTQSETVAHE
jgi:electron transport complex protein RnfE